MKKDPLHVKVILKVKPEFQKAFENELMSVRKMCIAEENCLAFDVERRSDDPSVYLLVETWSDLDYFEKVQLNRDCYPPNFARIESMLAASSRGSLLEATGAMRVHEAVPRVLFFITNKV